MAIKTVSHPPYRPDLASCDEAQRLSLWGNWGNERGCDEGHWHAHTRGLPWGLPEVVGTVQEVHCSRRRLLRRGLDFHVCTIIKSAHTKKVWKLIYDPRTCLFNICSSLLLQQCPPYLVRRSWMVLEIGGRWPYNYTAVLWDDSSGICSLQLAALLYNPIYPTPPLGQDMAQGQFLSGV